MGFHFINRTSQKIPRRYFLFALKEFLQKMNIDNPIEISLILLTPRQIKKLNYEYRRKNNPTDVLSFPIDIIKTEDIKKFKKDDRIILGDVYVCPAFIKSRVKKEFVKELQFIFIHGVAHLLGYNHEKQKKLDL